MIALGDLNQAQSRLAATAKRLATAGDSGDPTDTVDLSAEMVALMRESHDFATNVQVLKTCEEWQRTVLDLLA